MAIRTKLLFASGLFLAFVGVAYGASRLELQRRHRALAASIAEERALLPERPRALVGAMDDVILEAASSSWRGDFAAPGAATAEERAALFARPMLFVHAALPEVARLDAIGAAVRRSDKDTFALCLVKPPPSAAPDDVHTAATRYWLGSALFDDATHDILPLAAVHRGLRPLSRAFAAELAEATDHLALKRLEDEYEHRRPLDVRMARTAADAELLVVVVDELPAGVAEPEVGRSLTATRRPAILPTIEDTPHDVRIVVWSATARDVVLRVRARVDAEATPTAKRPAALAEMHGCQGALHARGTSL